MPKIEGGAVGMKGTVGRSSAVIQTSSGPMGEIKGFAKVARNPNLPASSSKPQSPTIDMLGGKRVPTSELRGPMKEFNADPGYFQKDSRRISGVDYKTQTRTEVENRQLSAIRQALSAEAAKAEQPKAKSVRIDHLT